MKLGHMSSGPSAFPSTRWTLIHSAGESPEARRAVLDELLSDYWRPLYAFARRKGMDGEGARDAVQGFVVHLLEQDFLSRLSPERGRMRSYLRTSMAHYLVNQYDKERAKKRGGDVVKISFDSKIAERTLTDAPLEAELAFDREWALTVMERAMERLRGEFESGQRRAPFAAVAAFFPLSGQDEPPSYKDVAARHEMTIPGLKSLLHRSRLRFRELVEEEARDTLLEPGQAVAEVGALLETLAR